MYKSHIIFSVLFVSLVFGQYDYSLEDINPTSDVYGEIISTAFYAGQVTLHYFGHQN